MNLTAITEGLLFIAGDEGITLDEIIKVTEQPKNSVLEVINQLQERYHQADSGLLLKNIGNKYLLVTKKEYLSYYQTFIKDEINNTLSPQALETLAIIAYNQPITRGEIDHVRGVSCHSLVRKLINFNLIQEAGRSDKLGRPVLYKTSDYFLDYFNINNLDELPTINIEVNSHLDDNADLYYTKYQEDNNEERK